MTANLLMTATIRPPAGATNLARVDPEVRLNDYQVALSFYIECLGRGTFDSIVFVENSGSDLDRLRSVAEASGYADRIRFISFQGLDYPPAYGRGYGEMRLVDHAMSLDIAPPGPDGVVWKVTGRYVIRNVDAIVSRSRGAALYCHCRNHPMRWVDMYLMGWTRELFESELRGCGERLREDDYRPPAEVSFRSLVDEVAGRRNVSQRFRVPPAVEGIRGNDSEAYESFRLKAATRRALARVLPGLWI